MKKMLLCFIAFIYCMQVAPAQPLRIGLSASLGNATAAQTIAGSIESRPFTLAALSGSFGAQVKYAITPKIYASGGVYYNISRLHNEFSWAPRFRAVIDNIFHQVQLPLLVHYRPFKRWSAGMGIVPQLFLAGRQATWFADGDELQLTRNSTGNLSKKFTLPFRAQISSALSDRWDLFLYYDLLPGGYFKDPNDNNQIYGATHQLQIGGMLNF